MTYNMKKIMNRAHGIYEIAKTIIPDALFSECLKEAWRSEKINMRFDARYTVAFWTRTGYEQVAIVPANGLDDLYKKTQNGVVSDSWSREADVNLLTPLPVFEGKEYGHRSTMTDDLFINQRTGIAYEVDMIGFHPLTMEEKAERLPV